MNIVKISEDASGYRPPVQSWAPSFPPDYYAAISEADSSVFAQFRGFVTFDVVYSSVDSSLDAVATAKNVVGNQAGLDAYLAEHPDPSPERAAAQQRITELKDKLRETDYQAIKYAEGWITAEDYEPIKTQRQAWRDEINTLETREQPQSNTI